MDLHGKTILVTGGASGIGLAMAQAFSTLGNRVLICGRDPEKLTQAERINPEFRVFRCDVTQLDQVGRCSKRSRTSTRISASWSTTRASRSPLTSSATTRSC